MEERGTYDEQVAKRVLARAIELDHVRGLTYAHGELRSIAAEVGVGDAAFDEALREVTPPDPSEDFAARVRLGWASAAVAGAVVGATAGIVDATTGSLVSPLAMGVLLMLSGGMAALNNYRAPGRGAHGG